MKKTSKENDNPRGRQPACSTIIPTIGRPELDRAIGSALDQGLDLGSHEIIVVNDSGRPLRSSEYLNSGQIRWIDTKKVGRSAARNAGAAIARGAWLHFLDDDDWLVPNGLVSLLARADRSKAGWVLGATQLVDRKGEPLIQLRHELDGNAFVNVMAGEWLPLQSSIIRQSAFAEAGGFDASIRFGGGEDVDLARRVLLRKDLGYSTPLVANVAMGEGGGSTTDKSLHAKQSRRARERILDTKITWSRLGLRTCTPSWRGRIARIYLTSSVWNLQHGQVSKAIPRLTYGKLALLMSGTAMFRLSFWRAVATPYSSQVFKRGHRKMQNATNS